jgi:medium-chain acyl-[acyl-carrier-protein] hydrolase
LQNDAFIKQMATYNGTPAEVLASPDLLELLLPMIKADFSMSEQYAGRSATKLDCTVFALGSTGDDWLDAGSIDGWEKVSSGGFQTKWFEGDHFYLNHRTEELVSFLSQKFSGLTLNQNY